MSLDSIDRILSQIKNLKDRLSALETREQKPTFYTLSEPINSPDWSGNARSSEGASPVNLITTFGLPENTKVVLVQLLARDSATLGTPNLLFSIGPTSLYFYAHAVRPIGGDVWATATAPAALDEFGNVFYRIVASGTGTLDATMRVWGYWI